MTKTGGQRRADDSSEILRSISDVTRMSSVEPGMCALYRAQTGGSGVVEGELWLREARRSKSAVEAD